MKNIYFESGNRAYVLNLCRSDEKKTPVNILRQNTGKVKDELLRFPIKGIAISNVAKNDDEAYSIKSVSLSDNKVQIRIDSESNIGQISEKNDVLSAEIINDQYLVVTKSPNSECTQRFSVEIIYKNLTGHIIVVCMPAKYIYDVVLDFGSEASQMLVQSRDSASSKDALNLFASCFQHFYGNEAKNNETFDQQDEDTHLFRSIFFARIENNNNIDQINETPGKNDPLLNFITERNSKNKGVKIPNVKISYLADLSHGLKMEIYHRGIVLRFIHEALASIYDLEKNSTKNSSNSYGIRLTLLVPNVMGQHDVSSFISDIQQNVSSKSFLSSIPEGMNIEMIDVRSCSESDASLLHWIAKKDRDAKKVETGKYLIIDIGKGTTDFSIVEVLSSSVVKSLFRSGFVGAGNVISYAVFENSIIHLFGVKDRTKAIQKLLTAEPAMLYRLEGVIEGIKRSTVINTAKLERLNADELSVETIIEKIKNAGALPDDFCIIEDSINKLWIEIFNRVHRLEYDHVILSGRAFNYEPLREMFVQLLNKSGKTVEYNSKDAKGGCLHGPLTSISVSKYMNIVGIPEVVDASLVQSEDKAIIEIKESLKKKEVRNSLDEKIKKFKEIAEKWSSLNNIFSTFQEEQAENDTDFSILGNAKEQFLSKNNQQPENLKLELPSKENNVITTGLSIPSFGQNTRIIISGKCYKPSNDYTMEDKTKYDIYFDGAEFYLRTKTHSWLLNKDLAYSDDNDLLFESLFPYSLRLLPVGTTTIPLTKAVRKS